MGFDKGLLSDAARDSAYLKAKTQGSKCSIPESFRWKPLVDAVPSCSIFKSTISCRNLGNQVRYYKDMSANLAGSLVSPMSSIVLLSPGPSTMSKWLRRTGKELRQHLRNVRLSFTWGINHVVLAARCTLAPQQCRSDTRVFWGWINNSSGLPWSTESALRIKDGSWRAAGSSKKSPILTSSTRFNGWS